MHLPLLIRRVHGHSMVPVLPPGTTIWGYKWFMRLKPDDVVIFLRDGKEMVKRIERITGDELFLLGDHVEASTDSRHFGALPRSAIIARVIYPRTRKPAL